MNNIVELYPRYDSAKSFYSKATVEELDDKYILRSYGKAVAEFDRKAGEYNSYGKFTQTTTRHQKEFRQQCEAGMWK